MFIEFTKHFVFYALSSFFKKSYSVAGYIKFEYNKIDWNTALPKLKSTENCK